MNFKPPPIHLRTTFFNIFNNPFLHILLLIMVIFIAFYNTLNSYFVADDFLELPTRFQWKSFISYSLGAYRPLIHCVWSLDNYLWVGWYNHNPKPYRITNWILHFLTCLGCYWIARLWLCSGHNNKKSLNCFFALIAAILFTVHPMHKAIRWISVRTESVCIAPYLLSVAAYGQFRKEGKRLYFYLSLIFFIFSLLAREMAITIPLAIVWWDLAALPIKSWLPIGWQNFKKYYWFYFLILGLYIPFRFLALGGIGQYGAEVHLKFGFFIFKNYVHFFRFLLLPDLHFGFSAWFAALALLSALIYSFYNKTVRWGLGWFFISLIPVCNRLADHYTYLPSVGFLIAFTAVLKDLYYTKYKNIQGSYLSIFLFIFLIPTFIIATINRNAAWQEAGEICRKIQANLLKLYPTLPAPTTIYFINLPVKTEKGAQVFGTGINNAVSMLYHDPTIQAFHYTEQTPMVLEPERNYLFLEIKDYAQLIVREDFLNKIVIEQKEQLWQPILGVEPESFKARFKRYLRQTKYFLRPGDERENLIEILEITSNSKAGFEDFKNIASDIIREYFIPPLADPVTRYIPNLKTEAWFYPNPNPPQESIFDYLKQHYNGQFLAVWYLPELPEYPEKFLENLIQEQNNLKVGQAAIIFINQEIADDKMEFLMNKANKENFWLKVLDRKELISSLKNNIFFNFQ